MKPLRSVAGEIFLPLRESAQGYDLGRFRADLVAAITVAVVALPQSMAYAVIAGVPPQYGIYAVIFQTLVGSLFSSQKLLSLGPINTQSLVVASTVTFVMRNQGLEGEAADALYLQLVFALTIMKGLLQLGFSVAQLGAMVRYVSTSVLVGFTSGAGVLIAAGQIHAFLGVPIEREAATGPGLIGIVQEMLPHLDQASLWAVGIGVGCVAIVLVSMQLSKMIPGPLLAIIFGAVMVAAFGLGPEQLTLVPEIPEGLPSPAVPWAGIAQWDALLAGAVALAVLGLMEAYSIGRSISAKTGDRINANQELFGQGLTHAVTGFFQCIPGSASFSRSALNYYAGAKTGFSGIYVGLIVGAVFLLLAPYAQYIPKTALAAILFVVAYGLIDWRYMQRVLRGERADAAVCFATFFATLFIPLSYAVFVGIVLNLALYLRKASRLHLQEMVRTPAGPFVERPLNSRSGESKVTLLQVEGDLFFGVADELDEQLRQILNSPTRVVIFRLKRTHSVDSTVMQVLERFTREMHERHKWVLVCGIKTELLEVFERFGLADVIGKENCFVTTYGVFTSAKQALGRARDLIGESIDGELDEDEDSRMEGWAYEI